MFWVLLIIGIGLLVGIVLLPARVVLWTGLVMLLIGGFPWIYTPTLMGTRGGDEGSGMLGTLIFIFVGVPGIIMFVAGVLRTVFGSE